MEKTPVNEFPYNSNFRRNYALNFDIEWTGELPRGGRLTISWSPGQSAVEKKIISGDGIAETKLTAFGVRKDGMGWYMNRYALVEDQVAVNPLPLDTHYITFEHTSGDGTFYDFVRLEVPGQKESAWAAGVGFPGNSWATYFNYVVVH